MVHQKAVAGNVAVVFFLLALCFFYPINLHAAGADSSAGVSEARLRDRAVVKDVPTKDEDWRLTAALIGAAVSLVGTIANAGLTLFSWRRADKQAKRAERVAIALDKFRATVRNSSQAILNDFCSYENSLIVAAKAVNNASARAITARRSRIKTVQNESYDAKYRHLTAHLRHVGYGHWVEELDDHWDDFYHALNSLILEAASQPLIDQAFERASKAISDLSQTLNVLLADKEQAIAAEAAEGA